MNYMISMFIDDELDIDEKISFIETVLKDTSFKDEALQLLHQEKHIRGEVVEHFPSIEVKVPFNWKRFFRPVFQPIGLVASALAATVIFLLFSIPSFCVVSDESDKYDLLTVGCVSTSLLL